ncbi:MAG: ribonuclease PH [Deltaproteobacteria bacterium]|nr:ribonuclease PH [Deltaproteobacteria bacterium]
MKTRPDGRTTGELRPVHVRTGVQKDPAGSVEISFGDTVVLCAASISDKLPGWIAKAGHGWVTAEYAMLPGAVPGRAGRNPGGRAKEIQRLIGRSLRAAIDLEALGQYAITIDCDVLQADGGTRVASITGGYLALTQAIDKLLAEGKLKQSPLKHHVLAVSCAMVDGQAVLDPCYDEDHRAEVDMNFVFTADGRLVEVQGTAEGEPFAQKDLLAMLELAKQGIEQIKTAL